PLADLGEAQALAGARVVSVGYLALTPDAVEAPALPADWSPWTRFFPWEDWRQGRPPVIDEVIAPGLRDWAGQGPSELAADRLARARVLFALTGAPWNEE